ncbi:hypothetical protein [Methylobacterium sp. Leaf466]|uniref:hypothetical protein n=1 Tax=Methylobacterium sp. Leaf466 TaxID=1736386 RepID=UPI0006F78F94|nr:hypothetical protein [Methylobacterium sp. Leaf466]KQT88917.1 hypothetical protein ASG59_13685 [Methylobacterium sp. Leaf466]
MPLPVHIELASSSDAAPLFLALAGERIVWTPDRDIAATFADAPQAWDAAFALSLPVVRVR